MWKALGLKWNPPVNSIGYLPGLYHRDYDPELENNEFNGEITKGILHPEFLQNNKGAEPLLAFWKSSKSRLWMLHPELYKAAGHKHHWGSNLSAWVVRPIFEYMHIRRTIRTPLKLPDGTMTYPGIDLFPPTIIVEEHTFDPQLCKSVQAEGFDLSKRLFKPNNDNGAIPNNVFAAASSQAIEGSGAEATLNFGIHRRGVLTTFDWRNTGILDPENSRVPGSKKDTELRAQALVDNNEPKTKPEIEKMQQNETAKHNVIVGVDNGQRLIARDPNGDFTWLYNMTSKDGAALAPSNRAATLRWVCHENPILTRTLELLYDRVTDNKRGVLIYVDIPWVQTVTVNVIRVAGFDCRTIPPENNQAFKDQNIHEWNDPYSSAQVFVANINTMSVGVNMHHCCFTGIFINWHLNMKTNWQCCGRLIRIGQKEKVEWIFLKMKTLYHDNFERLAVSKWAPQRSAEIELPK
ncbi:hypothetical protein FPOAC2_03901 [Fusarium poae]